MYIEDLKWHADKNDNAYENWRQITNHPSGLFPTNDKLLIGLVPIDNKLLIGVGANEQQMIHQDWSRRIVTSILLRYWSYSVTDVRNMTMVRKTHIDVWSMSRIPVHVLDGVLSYSDKFS